MGTALLADKLLCSKVEALLFRLSCSKKIPLDQAMLLTRPQDLLTRQLLLPARRPAQLAFPQQINKILLGITVKAPLSELVDNLFLLNKA